MQANDEALLGCSPEELLQGLPERVSSPLFEWAQRQPEAFALQDQSGFCFSYAALATVVRQLQAALTALGLRAGQRVLVVNENNAALAAMVLAVSELGAWPVIVNARMAAPELARIAAHSRPALTVYTLDSAAAVAHWDAVATAAAAQQLTVAGLRYGVLSDLQAPAEEDGAVGNEQVFTLLYTTGTTGDPKGVMLTHRNVLYVAAVTGALRGLRAADRLYAVLPISHVFGLAAVFLAAIYRGAGLVLADRFDAATALQSMATQQVSGLFGVPTMFARLVDEIRQSGLPAGGMPALRFMYAGGAPLEPALKQRAEAAVGLPLLNGYGMTETAPTICQVRFNAPLESCSVGAPIPGVNIRVLDANGQEVPRGEVGELHVAGPGVMRGYYRQPEATAAVLDAEGYLNTGDLVRQDEQGNIFIAGRSKELIIHSGFNVYPPEVEAALSHHPEVLICAVVGEAQAGNEQVVAYVQRTPGSELTAAALLDFVRPRLTAYKRPGRIEFRDQLPTAPSGKVLKHQLQ